MNQSQNSVAAPGRVRASVIVCTHNRADRLGGCLQSLAAQSVPAAEFEIIVVDDGSTDDTPAVCAGFGRLPNLRVIRQANAGLGAARERGWRSGSGPVLAFLDDDAEAPPGWLAQALARFDGFKLRAEAPVALGGPTRPAWERPRPAWLDDRLASWLTVWSPFSEYSESAVEPLFVGANMFFFRAALEQAGGFSARLGRRGANLLSHEESELWSRLRAAGFRSAHDPSIWVLHHIPASRMRPAWFRRRIYWEGVSMIRSTRPAGDSTRPGRALASLWAGFFGRPVLGHLVHPRRWGRSMAWQLHLAYKLGAAREYLRPKPRD